MTPFLASWLLVGLFLVSWIAAAAWAGRTVTASMTAQQKLLYAPIYTGAFIASLAFAFIRARPIDIIITAGFILFFALKARVEERFLCEQLGPDYDAYRARVPMLVPRAWRRRSAV